MAQGLVEVTCLQPWTHLVSNQFMLCLGLCHSSKVVPCPLPPVSELGIMAYTPEVFL